MASQETKQWSLPVNIEGKEGTLVFDAGNFSVLSKGLKGQAPPKPTLQTALRNVLWAAVDDKGAIKVSTLASKKNRHVLVHVSGNVDNKDSSVKEWTKRLMEMSYDGVQPERKLKVLVNPKGGPGKAVRVYASQVKPILEAAHCIIDMQETERRFHARDIAAEMKLDYDAILALSGDGLPHEIFNGLASRSDGAQALRIPVVPIPTGSANGFFLNLHGPQVGFDVGLAILSAIKGKPLALDLCSVTQGETRTWSFFSQAAGLMADLDLGTENLRWMGDTRFVLGFLRGIVQNKPSAMKLSIKSIVSDKIEMLKNFNNGTPNGNDRTLVTHNTLPDDLYAAESGPENGWVTFEKPILYLYSGLQPYVGRDLLQFPMANPSDGLLDVVIQEQTNRGTMLNALDGAEHGMQFWLDTQHYYKAKALRIEPLGTKSKPGIAIDGEAYTWSPMYVEVHEGLGTTLSLHGRFIQTFSAKPPKNK